LGCDRICEKSRGEAGGEEWVEGKVARFNVVVEGGLGGKTTTTRVAWVDLNKKEKFCEKDLASLGRSLGSRRTAWGRRTPGVKNLDPIQAPNLRKKQWKGNLLC